MKWSNRWDGIIKLCSCSGVSKSTLRIGMQNPLCATQIKLSPLQEHSTASIATRCRHQEAHSSLAFGYLSLGLWRQLRALRSWDIPGTLSKCHWNKTKLYMQVSQLERARAAGNRSLFCPEVHQKKRVSWSLEVWLITPSINSRNIRSFNFMSISTTQNKVVVVGLFPTKRNNMITCLGIRLCNVVVCLFLRKCWCDLSRTCKNVKNGWEVALT